MRFLLHRFGRSILFLSALFIAAPAMAQLVGTDTAPGASCTGFPAGASRVVADADGDGTRITLICNGTIWLQEGIIVLSKTGAAPIADGGSGVTPAGSTGEIQYNDGGTALGASSNFFWDVASNSLGIGLNNPDSPLHIRADNPDFKLEFSSTPTNYADIVFADNGVNISGIGQHRTLSRMDIDPDLDNNAIGGILRLMSNTTLNYGSLSVGKLSDPNVELDVAGDINFTGTITDVSDRRQKTDIRKLTNTLKKLRVASRTVVWLSLKKFRFQFVPVFHGLQGRLAAQG